MLGYLLRFLAARPVSWPSTLAKRDGKADHAAGTCRASAGSSNLLKKRLDIG